MPNQQPTYREQVDAQRIIQIREILKDLPQACGDFIRSIAVTTGTFTRLAYAIDLRTFFTFLQRERVAFADTPLTYLTDQQIGSVTQSDLTAYIEYLTYYFKEQDADEETAPLKPLVNHELAIKRKLSAIRSFYEFLFKNQRISANVTTLVSLPKIHEKPIIRLSQEEMIRMLEQSATGAGLSERQKTYQKLTAKRDFALISLFLGTGIRVSECVGLNISDVDLENNAFLVTRKGGNQVVLYFPPEVATALADYLEEYRGVRCTAEQVVVGAGMEYLLSLLAPLLPGKTAVENPGYQRAKQVLENNGVACCCLPVDADGLSVEALSGSGAAVCYVTPSHQFPTGVTMPAGRRTELLHWASRCPGQRYIIEDDYDSEFRFDTRPLPSLQGMAGADGPVVYLSTCSRSLAPGIRIAYMVLPRQLLPAWRAKYRIYSGTVSRFEQQTLARFIREGYFTRHLARERVAYKARRDALAASLHAAFAPDELTLTGLHTGLHLLARLKNAPPDAALRAAAKAQGVALSLLSDYDLTGGEQDFSGTFVLGYGSLSEASFPEAGETLRKVCTAAREASVTV